MIFVAKPLICSVRSVEVTHLTRQPSALASSRFRCKELKTNTAAVATRNKDAQRISSLTQPRYVFAWFQQSHSSWLL